MEGTFSMYAEPESPNDGLHLRCMMNRCRQTGGGGGVFRMYNERLSPSEGYVQQEW